MDYHRSRRTGNYRTVLLRFVNTECCTLNFFFLWLIKQFQNSLGFSASYVNFDFSDFLGIKSISKSVEKLSLKQEFRWRRPVL